MKQKTYRPLTLEQAQPLWELNIPFEYRHKWGNDGTWWNWQEYGVRSATISPKDLLTGHGRDLSVELRIEVEEDDNEDLPTADN
jgi:hypothetical protein